MTKGAAKFSKLGGALRVGARYFESRGLLAQGSGAPHGLVDDLADLANPEVDVARIHPDVARFFVDTAGLELHVVSRWRFPFSWAWLFARPILAWIGQLVLPRREGTILTRLLPLEAGADGRDRPRGVIREYASGGEVMQVVAYATSGTERYRFMNAAFPLPGGHLTGVLRLAITAVDEDGRLAVGVTSRAGAGDGSGAGIWYVLAGLPIRIPFEERLDLWSPAMASAPRVLDGAIPEGTTIVGRHEQRLFGVRVVTHEYAFRPRPHEPS